MLGAVAIFACVAGLGTGCTANFEDINRPGEALNYEELSEDNNLVGNFVINMQNNAFPEQENAYQMNYDLIGNYLGRYMTHANGGFNNKAFTKFMAPDNWVGYPFKDIRPKLDKNFKDIQNNSKPEDLVYQWARLLWVRGMLTLTDMYGPIPLGLDKENIDGYNSQEDVYKYFFNVLNEVISYLDAFNAANPGKKVFVEEDHVYSGDFLKWQKYANSLKLRMALRIRFVEPELAKQYAQEAVANGVITKNDENLQITYVPNGLYKMSVEWGDSRACADLDSYMNGYNDPRILKYFKAKTNADAGDRDVIGCLAGADIKNKAIATKLYSMANVEKTTRATWMCAAEMYFCRAEGAMLGWEMGGDAEDLYNQGIKASFDQWSAGSADSYIANATAMPADYVDAKGGDGQSEPASSDITIKWNDGDGRNQERISVQKWIAMFPNGQEGWCEIRRTGYPQIFDIPSSKNGYTIKTPNRIPFPPTQMVDNADNYQKAVTLLGGKDDYATKLWWQAK